MKVWNKREVKKEWKKLSNEFKRAEAIKGKTTTRKIPYVLKPFFIYLEEHNLELNEVNYKRAQDYQTWLATLENEDGSIHYSSSAICEMMNCARNFYKYLKTKGIIYSNPFMSIRFIRKEKKLPRHIPKEDLMEQFLDSMKCFWNEDSNSQKRNLYKIHVIAELMYATGLRISEVANLEVTDIDLEARVVYVKKGKGGKDRKAFLNEYAAKILQIYIEEMRELVNWKKKNTNLFGVKDGRNLDSMLNKWLKLMGKRIGIDRFTSHIFRHSIGFHLLRRGCGLRFIQLILGHEEINSTSIYTKVEKTDLRNELDIYHPRQFKKDQL